MRVVRGEFNRLKVKGQWWRGRGQSAGSQDHAHTLALTRVQQTRFPQFQQEVLVLAELSIVNDPDVKAFTANKKVPKVPKVQKFQSPRQKVDRVSLSVIVSVMTLDL